MAKIDELKALCNKYPIAIPLGYISPGRLGRYARRYGVNAGTAFRES